MSLRSLFLKQLCAVEVANDSLGRRIRLCNTLCLCLITHEDRHRKIRIIAHNLMKNLAADIASGSRAKDV